MSGGFGTAQPATGGTSSWTMDRPTYGGGGKGGGTTSPQPTPTAAPTINQSTNPNIMQQSAGAFNTALNTTNLGTQYAPQMLRDTDLNPYMNPFTEQVTNRSLDAMERARQMQMNQIGADATAAGAFGGSRHGVAESLTNEGFARQAGDMAAQMNMQGYNQALANAGVDINNNMRGAQFNMDAARQMGDLSNQAFGYGNTLNQQMMQQGTQQQMLQQGLIDALKQQYAGYQNSPTASLQAPLAALGATPSQSTTTSSKQPGLFDYLTLGLSII